MFLFCSNLSISNKQSKRKADSILDKTFLFQTDEEKITSLHIAW